MRGAIIPTRDPAARQRPTWRDWWPILTFTRSFQIAFCRFHRYAVRRAMIAKCPCDVCGENIEFSTDEFHSGSSYVCPHCQGQTVIFVSPKKKVPPSAPPPPPPPVALVPEAPSSLGKNQPPESESHGFELIEVGGIIFTIINCSLFFIGCALVLFGFGNEIQEETSTNGSAIRQTVFAIQYCSGLVLIALSLIIATLLRLVRRDNAPTANSKEV